MELHIIRQKLNMGIPLSDMNLRATDYSRVSTDHLEQKKSLKHQIERFDEMIKNNPNWTYVKGYVDDGISGTTDYKRDNFMKMIDDARAGKFDLIITKEISRFSRNTLDSIKYTRELLSYGVAVLFINDNINTALPDSELRLTIMASMAQDEIRRLSERVKFGMASSQKNGTILGNDTLYGYKKDKNSGTLYIVEGEAENVRRLYNMYAIDKMSLSNIAKIFNNEGIKTCRNKKWCTGTLSRMIKNPKYKGFYRGHTVEVIDYMTKKVEYIPLEEQIIYEDSERIPPLVSSELWEKANERLKSRAFKFGENFSNEIINYQNRYPLSSKIYCSHCNEPYHRRKLSRNSDDFTWSCSIYLNEGKKTCDSPIIRQSEVYSILEDIIKELKLDFKNVPTILKELYLNSKNSDVFKGKKAELNRRKNKILLKKEKILELNLDGSMSNNEFKIKNDEYNQELESIENEFNTIEQSNHNFDDIKEKNNELQLLLEEKTKKIIRTEKIIELLLDKMIVSKLDNDKYNYEIKMFFNFSKKYIKKELYQNIDENNSNTYNFLSKTYKFKRGYDKTSTRRYTVLYQIKAYISI